MTDTDRDAGAGEAVIAFASDAARAALYLAGLTMPIYAMTLAPEGAVQQIYQLNLAASGLLLIAATGCWGAMTRANRRR